MSPRILPTVFVGPVTASMGVHTFVGASNVGSTTTSDTLSTPTTVTSATHHAEPSRPDALTLDIPYTVTATRVNVADSVPTHTGVTHGEQILSSCTGAMLTSLLMTPFDVVKVRMQTQSMAPGQECRVVFSNGLMDHLCTVCNKPSSCHNNGVYYKSTLDAFVQIPKREGISSLWRGLAPTLVMAIPATVIYFTAYDHLKARVEAYARSGSVQLDSLTTPYTNVRRRSSDLSNVSLAFGDSVEIEVTGPDTSSNNATAHIVENSVEVKHQWLLALAPLIAGMTARFGASTIISPLELLRTKSQSIALNSSAEQVSHTQLLQDVRGMVKTHGLRTLWRGLGSTLWRDLPFSAIYWTSYEYFKHHPTINRLFRTDAHMHEHTLETTSTYDNFRTSFVSGACAGTLAAVATTPFDVVKTYQQVDLTGLRQRSGWEVAKDIYVRSGTNGLFAGTYLW
ncbi:hypothetical protein SARC_14009, partial [Sphaeroforma arctica JP610]